MNSRGEEGLNQPSSQAPRDSECADYRGVVLTYLRANDGNFRGGFGLVVALPVTAALLLPVALLLRRFGRAHALAVTSAGALVGAAVGIPEGIGREGGGLRLWLRGQPQRPQPPLHGVGLGHGARL